MSYPSDPIHLRGKQPEPVEALVERVRWALRELRHDMSGSAFIALTELAERVKAAERERDEWKELAETNAVEVKAWRARDPLAVEAQRDELVEALEAVRLSPVTGENPVVIASAALAKVKLETE